jgi:hypothetical protein
MTAAGPDTTPEDIDRLRGVRVVKVDPGRLLIVGAVVVIVVLAVSAVTLTISGARQNDRLNQLEHHGVPVSVIVDSCSGVSSGIAMAVEYWECRGAYTLGGHQYNEVIRGSRAHLNPGQTVGAVAVPGKPSLLSTPAAAARRPSAWSPYVTPIILGALAVVLMVALFAWSRRRRRMRTAQV